MKKPNIIQQITTTLNNTQLQQAPTVPDLLTGLMVIKKGQAKYALAAGELVGLNLAGLGLTDAQWSDILKLVDTSKLTALNLSHNDLEVLRFDQNFDNLVQLEVSGNERLRSISFGAVFPKLERLMLNDNALTKLNLSANFPSLNYLAARSNQLSKISFQRTLPTLECIDFNKNPLSNIDVKWMDKLPKLQYWYLDGSALHQSLKAHHQSGGNNYAAAFRALRKKFGAQEGILNQEYKVIIVGDGTAGKTCMVNRLVFDEFRQDDSTHGINIEIFKDEKGQYGFPYVLKLWDFGGQDIYHATHRLFLQADAVYLLVWNKKTETTPASNAKSGRRTRPYKNRKLDYWMRYILAYGKGSPVILVQTNKEKYPDYNHPQKGKIVDTFGPQLSHLQFVSVDSEVDDTEENGFDELVNELRQAIRKLKRKDLLPPQWVAVKNYLEELIPSSIYKSRAQFLDTEDATLEYAAYEAAARQLGVDDPELLLKEWLVPIGTVFYKEGHFEDKIILSQEWAIRAIYILFERNEDLGGSYHQIKENGGKFTGEDLIEFWQDYGQKERELFIDFMLACQMCYEVKTDSESRETIAFEERVFIAPEMLSDKRPLAFKRQEARWQGQACLHLRYDYDFAYYIYFQQFLVRTQTDAQNLVSAYRYGMHIYEHGQDALIEFDEQKRCMNISVSPNGKQLLDRIRNQFKDIHKSEVKTCIGVGESKMIALSKIEHFKGKGGLRPTDKLEAEHLQMEEAGIYAPFWLVDTKETFKPAKENSHKMTIPKTKIYFSYAWGDQDNPQREQLVEEMYQALKKAGFQVQRDKEAVGYGEYIDEFMEDIGRGDLIIVFISKKYLRSLNCMQELLMIGQRDFFDKDLFKQRIIPVQVEPIDFSLEFRADLNRYWLGKEQQYQSYIEEFGANLGDEEKREAENIINISKKKSILITRYRKLIRASAQLYQENDFALVKQLLLDRLSASEQEDYQAIQDLLAQVFDQLSEQIIDLKSSLLTSFAGMKVQTDKLFKGITDLKALQKDQQAALQQFYIQTATAAPTELAAINEKLDQVLKSHQHELPEHIVQLWQAAQQKSPMDADVKGKLKLKFDLIPFVVYEKELSLDLKKVFKDILADMKNGHIFIKPKGSSH